MTTEGVRAELDADRQRTVAQIAALSAVIDDVVASQADVATDDEHDPEGATIAFERQRVAALLDRARDHLSALDAAAARLDAGTYGGCERCGKPIGAERQAARPAAATCISCAASSG